MPIGQLKPLADGGARGIENNMHSVAAIREYCKECSEDVENCGGDKLLYGYVCPFYEFRLGTVMTTVKTIRKFCIECMGGSPAMVDECPSRETCPLFRYRRGE